MEKLSAFVLTFFAFQVNAIPIEDSLNAETFSKFPNPNPTVIVNVPGLGSIKGQINKTAPNLKGHTREMFSFTGIPYANKPKRFGLPQMRVPLTNGEIFDATKPSPVCWQLNNTFCPNTNTNPYTEDCLALNIYTPKIHLNNKPLPVILFIHGGAFVRWCSGRFDGRRLLNEEVILVTVNYRLNVFGFFGFGNDNSPGNLALYDQLLALEWTNRYISHFGGDASKITIAGQSAGSASVNYLMNSPLARGKFSGAISSSGDSVAGWAYQPDPIRNSLSGARSVGCFDPNNGTNFTQILNCMQDLTPQQLLLSLATFYSAPSNQTDFNLTVPKITPLAPLDALQTPGARANVPQMIGGNLQDGTFLLSRVASASLIPTGLINNATYLRFQFMSALLASASFGIFDNPVGLQDILIENYLGASKNSGNFSKMSFGVSDLFSALYFKAPILHTARAQSQINNTFMYSFDYFGSQTLYPELGGIPQVPRGVAHVDDLIYIFFFGEFTTVQDKIMSQRMVDFYVRFANTGNPNGPNTVWTPFNKNETNYLRINSILTNGTDYVSSWFKTIFPTSEMFIS